MACRMEGKLYAIDTDGLPETNRLSFYVAQPIADDWLRRFCKQVVLMPPAGVVGMAVGDESFGNWLPGVDVNPGCFT